MSTKNEIANPLQTGNIKEYELTNSELEGVQGGRMIPSHQRFASGPTLSVSGNAGRSVSRPGASILLG